MHRPGYCRRGPGQKSLLRPAHLNHFTTSHLPGVDQRPALAGGQGGGPEVRCRFELFSLEGALGMQTGGLGEERGFRPVCMQNVYVMSG